jgi:site-specific DNA recombinase
MGKLVIYARYSTDMQRTVSCDDQERSVRRDLPGFGVCTEDALVIRDEAESGTKSSRDGYQQLLAMIARGEVSVLAVDDQSRLTRADNASAFIQDLVYAGGRFISTSEGIDTLRSGWELGVKALEMKNSATIRNLSHLVRGGQEGRVLDDGSAGDFPFGYESFYIDANGAAQRERRGPKPKKGLRVHEAEAAWVRQVFAWFLEERSIAWIAKELTRQGASKDHRASAVGWHHQQVRRMLANEKDIGRWTWGATTTVRNSQGRTKQVATDPAKHVVRERPEPPLPRSIAFRPILGLPPAVRSDGRCDRREHHLLMRTPSAIAAAATRRTTEMINATGASGR